MRNVFLRVTLLAAVSISIGCKTLVHNHPTKVDGMYVFDQKECQTFYRAYPVKGPEGYRDAEKMEFIRRCLQDKGWVFSRE